jgi:hypothetical protein
MGASDDFFNLPRIVVSSDLTLSANPFLILYQCFSTESPAINTEASASAEPIFLSD